MNAFCSVFAFGIFGEGARVGSLGGARENESMAIDDAGDGSHLVPLSETRAEHGQNDPPQTSLAHLSFVLSLSLSLSKRQRAIERKLIDDA